MVRSVYQTGGYTYVLSKSIICTEDFGTTAVYGISIFGDEQQASVKDISDDYNYVYRLFELIIEEELYPEHLRDVVEDYLSGRLTKIIPFKATLRQPHIA